MSGSHIYRLKFLEGNDESMPDIEFAADDAYKALEIAHDRARRYSAELWRDGRKLCSIRRVQGEVWEIQPRTLLSEIAS